MNDDLPQRTAAPTDASDASPCDGQQQVLSRSAVGHISACRCGHLHVTLDYITVRFEPDAFRELVGMLGTAQHRLDQRRAGTAASAAADPSGLH